MPKAVKSWMVGLALTSAAGVAGNMPAYAKPAQAASMGARPNLATTQRMIASWPAPSRMAALDMIKKYGPPHEMTASMLLWRNNGPWKWTKVSRETVPHSFPMPHPDLLEQAIDYRVPLGKFDEIARYDGSVMVERTKGEMSARCDKEGANFLAINLAHDVATGRRSAQEARTYYAAAIQKFMTSKQMDPYMQGFQFATPIPNTGDPDQSVL